MQILDDVDLASLEVADASGAAAEAGVTSGFVVSGSGGADTGRSAEEAAMGSMLAQPDVTDGSGGCSVASREAKSEMGSSCCGC